MILFHLREGEIALRKWMMDKDTLGYSRWRSSKNLGELVSSDYLTFGELIWCRELISLTLLLLMGSETMIFELRAWESMYVVSYVAITLNCHPHNCINPLRPRRLGGKGWTLLCDKCASYALRILRVLFA